MLDTSRILEKGPEYLRKQMELEREDNGRTSAVERLAATKPNYVRGPHVTVSVSTSDTRSRAESPRGQKSTVQSATATPGTPSSTQESNMVEPNSAKKRPDSILLYREKCDLRRGSPRFHYRRKQTLLKSLRERNSAGAPVPVSSGHSKESSFGEEEKDDEEDSGGTGQRKPGHVNLARGDSEGGGSVSERARRGVSRSHSDVSSRYSRNFADFDVFFKFCGLESDVVESLGKWNFSSSSDERQHTFAKIRSVSMAVSDDEISHTSGDVHGLQEEEVKETRKQDLSVIERNARVIKWLYSCRNASQSGKILRDLD